jgi:flagellar biosynthesis protein FlhG
MDQAEGLRRLAAEMGPTSAPRHTRVISVASGKGGVGKSNLAVNLSIALSDLGRKVLLLDADLGLANVNVLLGVIPRYNLFHVIKGERRISEIVMTVPQGIDIIAGASGFTELANLNAEYRKKIIGDVGTFASYDYIIIDTAAGVSHNVLQFIQASDELIIITTPEPTSITDAYGIIKAVINEKFSDIRIVVNRVANILEGKKVSDKIIRITQQFLNTAIISLGYMYDDEALIRAVKTQDPVLRSFPSSRVSRSIVHIASVLDNRADATAGGPERDLGAFFKQLIKGNRKKK